MTTIVARNEPGASLLHDARRATDERADPTALAVTRRSPERVAARAAPPTSVLQMQPSHVQAPSAPAGPWELVQNLVAAAASSPGYHATHVAEKPADLVPERVAMPLVAAKATSGSTKATTAKQASSSSTKATTAKKTSSSSTKATTAKKTSSSSTSSSSSSSVTAKELAFLNDKNLSIQDKLYRFVALMTKKGDQELVDAMRSYETRRAASRSSSSSTSSSSKPTAGASTIAPAMAAPPAGSKPPAGGGGGGILGSIVGGISSAVGSVVDLAADGIGSLAKSVGGPLAAAAVTAVGLPELAPIASSAGSALAGFVADQTVGRLKTASGSSSTGAKASTSSTAGAASGSTTKTSSSSGSAASASGDFDEQLAMMDLQRLVEKQTAMFAALSNVMKSIHDAQSTAIQNIR